MEDSFYSLLKRPEILVVTETKLNVNSVCNVNLLNFELYHTDSPTLAGGAAIYITRVVTKPGVPYGVPHGLLHGLPHVLPHRVP